MTKWLFLILLLATPAWGTTYYINAQAGDGGDGSASTPWNQLSDITGIVAGDSVLLERGDTWRETLVFGYNGTSSQRITLGAYGTGADPKILGSNLVTGWTSTGGTEWQEVDPTSTITVASGSVSATAMPQTYDSYVYKDFGAGYFGGDFTIKFQFYVTAQSDGSYHGLWMLSNFIDSYNHHQGTSQETDDGLYMLVNRGGSTYHMTFRILEDGTIRQYNYDSLSTATTYYLTITRDDDAGVNGTGRINYYLNTGDYYPSGSNLASVQFDCAAGEQNDFQYCYATHSAHTGAAYTATASLSNLDLGSGVVDFTASGGSNVWSATLTTQPTQVYFDGTRGTKVADQGSVDGQYDWYWASNTLYTYATSDPDTLYTSPGVEASVRPATSVEGVLQITGDYVTVQDIEVGHSAYRGLEVENASTSADYVTLDGCTVEWNGHGGIVAANGNATNLTVEDCNVAHNNMGHIENGTEGQMEALSLEGTNTFTLRRNLVHDNCREGIDCKYGATGGAIYHNVCHDNGDANVWHGWLNLIQIYLDGCSNTSVYQNLIYGGTASPNKDNVQAIALGIENNSYPTTGIDIYSNVIYDCSEGVHFWNGAGITANFTNNDIVNNTFVSCGYGIRWVNPNGNVVTPNTLRNNIFWQDTGYAIQDDTTANDGITNTTITHNGFALGQSSETKGTDYQELASAGFTNLTNRDLSLVGTSGFIGYAYTLGSPFDAALRIGSTWPDGVLSGDQDDYGTGWEIGAYLYETAGSGFLSWTETGDSRSQLTVTETWATGACDQDTGARLWKDFGASYFDSDFTHRWIWKGDPDSAWTANQTSYQGMIAGTEGPYNTVIGDAGSDGAWVGYTKGSDTTVTVTLRIYHGTTQEGSDSTNLLTTGTLYYMQMRRIDGTGWELKIWTGGYNGTLIDTLSVTATTSPAYRYYEAYNARSDGTQGNKTNWYIESLDLGVTGPVGTPMAIYQLLQRRR